MNGPFGPMSQSLFPPIEEYGTFLMLHLAAPSAVIVLPGPPALDGFAAIPPPIQSACLAHAFLK
jgi:hypothetical protein